MRPVSGREVWPSRVGRFRVEEPVGAVERTAMFLARSALGEDAVVKMVPRPGPEDPDALRTERFLAEAANLHALDHPGLVSVLDAGVEDDCYYLVLGRIPGTSLAALVEDESVDFGSLLAIALEVGDTLAQLHAVSVTVRDLEPTNIVIDTAGRAVIAGVALSALTRVNLASSGDVLGVPGFVAPELLLGLSPSPLSDQFAFGRLLLFLANVTTHVELDPAQPLRPQLEASMAVRWEMFPTTPDFDSLRPILERLTMRRAAERYPSVQDAVDELVQVALRFAPEPDGADETVPVDMNNDTVPSEIASPRNRRTRSIVVANDGVLSIAVEDVESLSGPVAVDDSLAYLDQLRQNAERHLSHNGGAQQLSSLAGLPSSSPAVEPTTVPSRVVPPADAEQDFVETLFEEDGIDGQDEVLAAPRVAFTVRGDTQRTAPPVRAAPARDETKRERPRDPQKPIPPPEPQPTALAPRKSAFNWAAFLTTFVLVFGAIWIVRVVMVSVDGAMLKPDVLAVAADGAPRFVFTGEAPLSAAASRRARGHFARARVALEENRVAEAEAELGHCIELADLPECHRTLAALLSLVGDPAAGAHLSRYLESGGADVTLRDRLKR